MSESSLRNAVILHLRRRRDVFPAAPLFTQWPVDEAWPPILCGNATFSYPRWTFVETVAAPVMPCDWADRAVCVDCARAVTR